MIKTNNPSDNIHKAWMYRVLEAIAGDQYLPSVLYFKGGTCASMLGWLDRFSVDLDFDFVGAPDEIGRTRDALEAVFMDLGLSVSDKSKNGIQYFLKYDNDKIPGVGIRNTLKIDATFPLFSKSKYAPERFKEIDCVFICQTKETMFSHKLCAPMDRFLKTGGIAGRDFYDIHHFFMNGYEYDTAVILERTGFSSQVFFEKLFAFTQKHLTEKVVTEDLSSLLSPDQFKIIRKVLKREVLEMLKNKATGVQYIHNE